jgi:hypothetical protein
MVREGVYGVTFEDGTVRCELYQKGASRLHESTRCVSVQVGKTELLCPLVYLLAIVFASCTSHDREAEPLLRQRH